MYQSLALSPDQILSIVDTIFRSVFRQDLGQPGFIVLEMGAHFGSTELRNQMVTLKNALSAQTLQVFHQKLNYQWLGRFDQQETTKFHRDNAAEQSFLMLGYEPSEVKSRLSFADHCRYMQDNHLDEETFYQHHNPMFKPDETYLQPYSTNLDDLDESHYRIVLMNNSIHVPAMTYGVLHKAEIIEQRPDASRIINSMMLQMVGPVTDDPLLDQEEDFIITAKVNRRQY